ncbi:L-galactose dehydrogenase-like isoform X2 [Zootermopsis nevadensis]|uniref:Putative oxidoreductase yajO n=2 Tax=Zootermopsis nevadensis TaxID=136037 RepID=A0A067RUJ9_ZOONE|nr:L-galactose dehydrogenase-like isoform X2 [Zootermopsis nevadensis]XP_021924099.1 L-galactose dehydrogenase-like isoform X2 [Zootermopsis nevadensis]XP_021924183.1 L-galactose dehydrogenase-like isoform X2 [Zootermopsis nevadensis]XP_021924272.1 L-galactose dehydrogenase-like isoform X2 [Zootermopsis nevadensis]KDR24485.1 putative oxidoreductase yajO [Zootermopsis nevadensis]
MTLPDTYVAGFHDEAAVRKMRYNVLGNTGLRVSHLAFGAGPLGGRSTYGEYDEAEAIAAVHEALKQGINYIDTAPWYGQGRSEELLGKALKDVPRNAYYIATKVARYEVDPRKMFDFSRGKTLESVDHSLKLLGLDYVDIIQVHDIEFAPDVDIVVDETLPALQSVVAAGKARYIGVTGYPVSVLKKAIERSNTKVDTVLSYTRDTLIDDTLKKYLPFFQSKGLGIIHAAGVSMGLLSNGGPMPWHPAPDNLKKVCAAAGQYCKERGVELARLALHYTMGQPGIATHLVGMNSREILNSNLDILNNGLSDLEKTVLQEINTQFFDKIKPAHWEDIEINNLKEKLKALNE